MLREEAEYPSQAAATYLRRVLKCSLLLAFTTPVLYGAIVRTLRLLGVEHDEVGGRTGAHTLTRARSSRSSSSSSSSGSSSRRVAGSSSLCTAPHVNNFCGSCYSVAAVSRAEPLSVMVGSGRFPKVGRYTRSGMFSESLIPEYRVIFSRRDITPR